RDMTFTMYVEGEGGRVNILAEGSRTLSVGESFSLSGSNTFQTFSTQRFDRVCVQFDTPPEAANTNKVCNAIQCRSLPNVGDYSGRPPRIIQEPTQPSPSVEGGSGGSMFNYEGFR
ncbi:MAG: hypothetical protein ACMXYA_03755, partial [Candidatus Woesearchaeota archaeon]